MFYKVLTPIGSVIVRSTCNNINLKGGFCECYRKYEHHKNMSLSQFMDYQRCKNRNKTISNEKQNNNTIIKQTE